MKRQDTTTAHDLHDRAGACGCPGHHHAPSPTAMEDGPHGHGKHRHDPAGPCCGPTPASGTGAIKGEAPPPWANRTRFRLDNMDCPVEERMIRGKLERMPGVVRLDFNLLERELTVYHRLADAQLLTSILEGLEMAPTLLEADQRPPAAPSGLGRRRVALLTLAGLAATGAEALAWTTADDSSWPVILLALLSLLAAGLPTLRKGWVAVRNMTLNIHFLMSLAIAGAIAIGKWPEVAMVVFLFALAEAIETLSMARVRNAVASLNAMAPETAEVRKGSEWREEPVSAVPQESRIRVRSGSRVPLDARVETGHATLNQAPITGESLPVDKRAGDQLFAGSIVIDGVVEATVTAAAGESTLARIAAAIQQAQAQRAPTQRFVDRFARYYTPAVVALAAAVALLGPLLGGGGWSDWLYRSLVMLVIACPCALVLSTPVTVVSGLTAAARHGILVKGGVFLENSRLLKAVALDKTGTLTWGAPVLTDVIPLSGLPLERALLIAASLDDQSTHPVAKALVAGWRLRQPHASLLPVENFAQLNGHGVQGDLEGGRWFLGSPRLAASRLGSPELEARLNDLVRLGRSAAVLFSATEAAALFGVADSVRSESRQAVEALKNLGIETVMLTGDNSATARSIADRLGIDDARAEMMPEDKLAAIAELKTRYGAVGMVGDGVNDAPALARADIGFAMGAAGTATALETADVAIMDDDPRKVAACIALSHRCSHILQQNIALAIGIKAVFLLLAFTDRATLWMAVFADVGASLLVLFNGLRLLRFYSASPRGERGGGCSCAAAHAAPPGAPPPGGGPAPAC